MHSFHGRESAQMYSLREKVGWFAFTSRVFLIVTQVIANVAVPDHNADAFVSPKNPSDKEGMLDRAVTFLFGGFHHWDAEYFLHISRYGYTHENCLAFFPLYPLILRWISYAFNSLFGAFLNCSSAILFTSVIFNFLCFIWTALALFDLSKRYLKNEEMAYRSAILFCVSPASIFFMAPYSETLFALLTFHGMLWMTKGYKEIIRSSIPFGLSTAVRSNGVISAGFLIHSEAQAIVNVAQTSSWFDALFKSFKSSLRLLLGILLLVAPFATFQVYAVVKFCNPNGDILPAFLMSYSAENDLVVPGVGDPPAWCNSSILPYTAVQSQYWNVGFLRYFQWKQLPNFLLATPMFVLILRGSLHFFKQHKELCYNLGLWKSKTNLKRRSSQSDVSQNSIEGYEMLEFPPEIFVYIAHVLSLLLFCFFFVHIQVTTRLIASASPVPYWFAAYFFSPFSAASFRRDSINPSIQNYELNVESEENLCSIWRVFVISDWTNHPAYMRMSPSQKFNSQLTKWYFISFTLIGTVLFSNNLPWT